MSIQEANGDITIGHATPITLTYAGEDSALGIEKFAFADNSLTEAHFLFKRDFGRKVSGSTASRKGKITILKEKVLADSTRRSMTQTVNLIAHSDFTSTELEASINDLGQFLLDNAVDLAAGNFDS
jgi:hypothetical protein